MSRYRIKFGLEAPIELKDSLALVYQGREVRLVPGDGPYDVEAEIDYQADDFLKAAGLAADEVVRPVLDAVAFHRKTRITLWGVTRVLKAEPGQATRRLILVDTRKQNSRVPLSAIWAKPIQQLLDAMRPDLARPLRWLRNAFGCRSPFEEFIYTWLALENMAGMKEVRKKCQQCGYAAAPYKAPNRDEAHQIVSGSDPSIDGATFHAEWWDRLRNTVFHGKEQLDSELLNDVTQVLDRLRPAVETYVEQQLNVTSRPLTHSPFGQTWLGLWQYLEFDTAQPAADFADDSPSLAKLSSIVDTRGITAAERELKCRWLRATDFENW
jgi:hypothetical protein